MRYKYLIATLILSTLFAQNEISLERVLDGTFRTESIGRYDWKNSSDSFYSVSYTHLTLPTIALV